VRLGNTLSKLCHSERSEESVGVRLGSELQTLRFALSKVCHSERSEESAVVRLGSELQTLRFAQGDGEGFRVAAAFISMGGPRAHVPTD
jgi:hypothetical protein